ncbi:Spy/CpxP family protein refolding chaperone [Hydrogenophaga sp.]|uniref:Spy/CpxP family protein refolding chaperone n=1 Tax=Hydrogenophaga sp. TaxID=1904254 RepID=UPI00286D9ACD|nr:Spy/CpxP family protein refolding chaperone [Hydrogenophaga sp.]
MKPNTTKAVIATVLAAAFAGLSITAIAQNATVPGDLHAQHMAQRVGGPMDPARMAEMQQKMAERHAQRMERLKAELKITTTQEPAWNAYVARTAHTPRQPAGAVEDWSKLTTPQRLEKMQALHTERNAEMAKRIDATKSFYAQLTPDQQKTFDAQGGGLRHAGMKGEHRMGGQDGHSRHGGKGQQGMGGGMGCEGGPMPQSPMGGSGPRS